MNGELYELKKLIIFNFHTFVSHLKSHHLRMKIKPNFIALLTYLPSKDGVKTSPVSSGYRPSIKFPFDLELYIGMQNFIGTDLVFPGDTATAEIALLKSEYVTGKIYEGLDFDFFEGENLIGHGVVTKIINPDDIDDSEE